MAAEDALKTQGICVSLIGTIPVIRSYNQFRDVNTPISQPVEKNI
jgi:hypothetical protein